MPTYIFPGQGSQVKGMGANLFSKFSELTAKADSILGYSIANLCLQDPNQCLNQTQFTQPAIYIVNALSYFNKVHETSKTPNYVAGHSLGEYNALLAADVFDFATGLKLVKKRSELMGQSMGGGMAAVVGLSAELIKNTLKEHHLLKITIANYNTNKQFVISGKASEISLAHPLLEEAGAVVIPLKVSGAFHSSYMCQAQEEFSLFLKDFHFYSPKIPVIANCTARPYQYANIKLNLAKQIAEPVLWTETINYLIDLKETEFEEVGPNKVLTGLVNRIKNGQ